MVVLTAKIGVLRQKLGVLKAKIGVMVLTAKSG